MSSAQIMDIVSNFLKENIEDKDFQENLLIQWNSKKIKTSIKKVVKNKLNKIKDVNKPKKNQSSYMFFCTNNRELIKSKMQKDSKQTEVMVELGKKWNELKNSQSKEDLEKVKIYENDANNDKERYTQEMENYEPPIQQAEIFSSNRRVHKDPNKPKSAKSAYILFCAEYRESVKADVTDPKEITRNLAKLWNEFKIDKDRTDEYQKFIDLSTKDKLRYNKDLVTYNLPSECETSNNIVEESKKKTNGYINFSKENRSKIKSENQDDDSKNITKLVSISWNKLTDDEKSEWSM